MHINAAQPKENDAGIPSESDIRFILWKRIQRYYSFEEARKQKCERDSHQTPVILNILSSQSQVGGEDQPVTVIIDILEQSHIGKDEGNKTQRWSG